MPSFERESQRIVIAGASSLLGAELKSLLEESMFAGWDFRLVDEEIAAGTLTEAGGQAAVIQPLEEDSFKGARLVFFTGSPEFTRANIGSVVGSSAKTIDLTGAVFDETETAAWFPGLEKLQGGSFDTAAKFYATPSAGGMATSALALALLPLGLLRLCIVFFQPVSEAGRQGIEELESQTKQLLSFQTVGQTVFDAQVAFNLLDRYGESSPQKLTLVRERVSAEAKVLLKGKDFYPAIQVLHAPVFYGTTFTAAGVFDPLTSGTNTEKILNACRGAGFGVDSDSQSGPSNVSAAGQNSICLGIPEVDAGRHDTWWFWGAADNIRLPAWNAVKLAEKLAG